MAMLVGIRLGWAGAVVMSLVLARILRSVLYRRGLNADYVTEITTILFFNNSRFTYGGYCKDMTATVEKLRSALYPPVPGEIRDEFLRLTASRMQSQSRLLFLTLLLTTPTAAYAASADAPSWVRIGLPSIMALACLAGFLSLSRELHVAKSTRCAQKLIGESTWMSSILACVCSAWAVMSWLGAAHGEAIYYAMILCLGSLATGYCLSSVRKAALANLVIGIAPITALLLTSGNRMDLAAGTSLLVATAFLMRMIVQQHGQLVDLLLLQRQMRILSETDPLTGLLNRRGLDARLATLIGRRKERTGFSVALLDLDGFKPVNDRFGHGVGDLLLKDVADRLRHAAGEDAVVARLGGDEFALLLRPGSAIEPAAVGGHMLSALVPPAHIAGHSIAISASVGVAHWPGDGASAEALFEAADRALYAAKALVKAGAGPMQRVVVDEPMQVRAA